MSLKGLGRFRAFRCFGSFQVLSNAVIVSARNFRCIWDNHDELSDIYLPPQMFRSFVVVSVVFFAFFIALGYFAVQGQRPESPVQPNQAISPIAASAARTIRVQRIREGTAFKDLHVFFRQIDDRTALYTVEDNRRFMCLENLALERILTTMQEMPERYYWKVDGEFTEFRGENFIIIRRAVVARSP